MRVFTALGFGSVCLWAATAVLVSQSGANPGNPLPGITADDFERFRIGRADFLSEETVEDGLGPTYNGTSCAVCHSLPAIGGIGLIAETRAGYLAEDGTFTAPPGGTLAHLFSIPNHKCTVEIPADANVIARRVPIALFGDGLIEAIPDETILERHDPDDRDGDGIRGRAHVVLDVATGRPRVGRFGWKAQQATLLAFAGDAYRNEMGITNDLFPHESAMGYTAAALAQCDSARDPEDLIDHKTGMRAIDKFEVFMKFLAPVERGPLTDAVRQGEIAFREIGCASCHTPVMITGPSSNRVFDRKPVPLFSDLLLHNVGTGDGIQDGQAGPRDIRTPPLWGVRLRRPLLHDGSASTLEEAIVRHRGEAERSRTRFQTLSRTSRDLLLSFLKSL